MLEVMCKCTIVSHSSITAALRIVGHTVNNGHISSAAASSYIFEIMT